MYILVYFATKLSAVGCGLRVVTCELRAVGSGLHALGCVGCGLWAVGCGLRAAGCGLRAAGLHGEYRGVPLRPQYTASYNTYYTKYTYNTIYTRILVVYPNPDTQLVKKALTDLG